MKDRIKELMAVQHMNQKTFANFTGINPATLNGIFTGRNRPTLNVVEAIIKRFPNVSLNWLMFGQGNIYNESSSPSPTSPIETAPSQNTQQQDLPLPLRDEPETVTSQRMQNPTTAGGDLFSERPAQIKPSQTHQMPSTNSVNMTPQRIATYHHIESEPIYTTPPQEKGKRKVSEIRIFYDDQTWESFVPKNSDDEK